MFIFLMFSRVFWRVLAGSYPRTFVWICVEYVFYMSTLRKIKESEQHRLDPFIQYPKFSFSLQYDDDDYVNFFSLLKVKACKLSR